MEGTRPASGNPAGEPPAAPAAVSPQLSLDKAIESFAQAHSAAEEEHYEHRRAAEEALAARKGELRDAICTEILKASSDLIYEARGDIANQLCVLKSCDVTVRLMEACADNDNCGALLSVAERGLRAFSEEDDGTIFEINRARILTASEKCFSRLMCSDAGDIARKGAVHEKFDSFLSSNFGRSAGRSFLVAHECAVRGKLAEAALLIDRLARRETLSVDEQRDLVACRVGIAKKCCENEGLAESPKKREIFISQMGDLLTPNALGYDRPNIIDLAIDGLRKIRLSDEPVETVKYLRRLFTVLPNEGLSTEKNDELLCEAKMIVFPVDRLVKSAVEGASELALTMQDLFLENGQKQKTGMVKLSEAVGQSLTRKERLKGMLRRAWRVARNRLKRSAPGRWETHNSPTTI